MTIQPHLLYLSRADVAQLLPPISEQLRLVEAAYRSLARGHAELPPKPGIHPRPNSFIHAMPAYLADLDVAALKWVSGYPDNKAVGLPYISGIIVVNDPATGLPTALMDAAEITAARTAAASGVCITNWAPPEWNTAAILGCGEQGQRHADVLLALNPGVSIRLFDPDLAQAASIPGVPFPDPREAVTGSDVVITAGPILDNPDSPLTRVWLGDSWLLIPIDFDFYASVDAIDSAEIFTVDDIGQFEYYRSLGHFRHWRDPDHSVGRLLEESIPAPTTIACVNLGIGVLDAILAAYVVEEAIRVGLGLELPR